MTPLSEYCRICRFYRARVKEESVTDYGQCQRMPPQLDEAGDAYYPPVHEEQWCGEFKYTSDMDRFPEDPHHQENE